MRIITNTSVDYARFSLEFWMESAVEFADKRVNLVEVLEVALDRLNQQPARITLKRMVKAKLKKLSQIDAQD